MNMTEQTKLERELREHVEELSQRIDAISREAAALGIRRDALIEIRSDILNMLSRNGGAK